MRDIAFQAESFEFAMGCDQQSSAGSFVASTRLDPHEPIFHESTRPIALRAPISFSNSTSDTGSRFMPLTETGIPFSETDRHLFFTVGRFLRRTRDLPGVGERRVGRVFQLSTFVADVPQIAIAAVDFLPAGCDRNSMAFPRSRDNLRATSRVHSRHGAITLNSGASA